MMFFLDESGHDLGKAPYEVRAALAIPIDQVWRYTRRINDIEKQVFGICLHEVGVEFKGNKHLSKKKFRIAAQMRKFADDVRREKTRSFLVKGAIAKKNKEKYSPTREEMTAYAQSCIVYAEKVILAAIEFNGCAFAAVVEIHKHKKRDSKSEELRKDYRYLLDRFGYYINSLDRDATGILVFDETEKTESRRLLNQFDKYVNETIKAYDLPKTLIPAPFFVDSELTPMVQVADLIAYIVNWGVRFGYKMKESTRRDLRKLTKVVRDLEWQGDIPSQREALLKDLPTKAYGFFHVENLHNSEEEEDHNLIVKQRGDGTQPSPHENVQGTESSLLAQTELPL